MPIRLTNKEMREVLELGHRVLACHGVDELRSAALDQLIDIFRCESANFFLTKTSGDRLELNRVVTKGISGENLDRFEKYYYRLDPFIRHFPPPAPVLTMDQVTPDRNLVRSEYYNDFLRPQAIHHQMTITANIDDKVAGVVALFRPKRRKNFSPSERAKAGLCASYLTGALEKAANAERAHRHRRVAETLAAGLPCRGVLVADESLSVVYRNQDAARLLGPGRDGIETGLPGEVARSCRELLDRAGEKSRRLLLEVRGQDRPVDTAVRLIDRIENGPLFLISLGDDRAIGDWIGKLEARGLSRREIEVAHLVLDGLTNTETAKRLYISENTVENHLKSIFRKLGIKNRTSLIRLLMDHPLPGKPD